MFKTIMLYVLGTVVGLLLVLGITRGCDSLTPCIKIKIEHSGYVLSK